MLLFRRRTVRRTRTKRVAPQATKCDGPRSVQLAQRCRDYRACLAAVKSFLLAPRLWESTIRESIPVESEDFMNCKNRSIRRVGSVGWASVAILLGSTFAAFGQSDGKSAGDAKADSKDHPTIRIRAGSERGFKDSQGNTWLPDKESKEGGFKGGDTIERPDLEIKNTKDPELYRAEHYSMDSFSWQIPNGKYIVKLHFCETFDGIGGPRDRVFSYKVQDKEFKDFDVWKKTGGPQRPYIETVGIDVTDGKLHVVFTPKVENPQINGIEIIPLEKASAEDKAAAEKSKAADKTSSAGSSGARSVAAATQPPGNTPMRLTSQEDLHG